MADQNEVEQSVLYLLKKRLERPSPTYPALTKLNETRLRKIVKDKRNDSKLSELVKRRNHYTNKIYEYLNEQLESRVAGHSNALPRKSTVSESRYRGPEVRFITNRYHAELYILHHILEDTSKSSQIKQLIEQQLREQEQWKEQRDKMKKDYLRRVENVTKGNTKSMEGLHPSKLQLLKSNSQGSLERLKNEYEAQLGDHNSKIISYCKHASAKTAFKFKELGIPFFCTVEHFKYPSLNKDQEHILDYLQKVMN